MDSAIAWFGNPEGSLGLPFPAVMAYLATLSEIGGAILHLIGLAVRWISIPLMITMVVAAVSAHWHNGWQAVADAMSPFPPANIEGIMNRLKRSAW